jgi:hypothetical protein
MLTQTNPSIDDLLGRSIASLDIPEDVRQIAVARYEAVAQSLEDRWQSGVIYPQGSFRLGTVVRPIHEDDEYDIDLVCRREKSKASTTQAALKAEVGTALQVFVASGPEGRPRLKEGKRCWTLDYPSDPFHLDSLPAIPDEDATPSGILLTDRALREWQHSDPIAYSEWFYAVMAEEFALRREILAKRMQVDDVPDWRVKTTLQRAVQALKRHRDIYFADRDDVAPVSIIITTLAGRAYSGPGDLFEVLLAITRQMPDLVEKRNGVYWIPNPVQRQENFADRWNGRPDRASAFFEWVHAAQRDIASIGDGVGIDGALRRIEKALGSDAMKGGGSALASDYRGARDSGSLKMDPKTGGLAAAASGVAVQRHTFHGESA